MARAEQGEAVTVSVAVQLPGTAAAALEGVRLRALSPGALVRSLPITVPPARATNLRCGVSSLRFKRRREAHWPADRARCCVEGLRRRELRISRRGRRRCAARLRKARARVRPQPPSPDPPGSGGVLSWEVSAGKGEGFARGAEGAHCVLRTSNAACVELPATLPEGADVL